MLQHVPDSASGAATLQAPLFTVVLLGYQCAPYLPAALASVDRQTFRGFDVLCIVEESSDGSLAMCRGWAAGRVGREVVPRPRSGSGAAARNYAISHAKGRYLVFLDGDDWLAPCMLERLADRLRETGDVDILAFAAVTTTQDTVDWGTAPRLSNFDPADAHGVLSGFDALRAIRNRESGLLGYSWLNAFRTDFLRRNRLFQTPGLRLEDYEHFHRALFSAGKVAYLDETLYAYRRRRGSSLDGNAPSVLFDIIRQIRTLLDFAHATPLPRDILSFCADQWLNFLDWMLFHSVTSRGYSREDCRHAFAILSGNDGGRLLAWLVRHASLPHRLAWPFFRLAMKGNPAPARWFFRGLYYPLAALRDRLADYWQTVSSGQKGAPRKSAAPTAPPSQERQDEVRKVWRNGKLPPLRRDLPMNTVLAYVLVSGGRDVYAAMLLLSLHTLLRRNPGTAVHVVMDEATHRSLEAIGSPILAEATPVVVPIPPEYSPLQRSRYLKTTLPETIRGDFLFIDTDTLVADRLDGIDLVDADLAMVTNLHSRPTGDNSDHWQDVAARAGFPDLAGEPYYNSGVIFARDTPAVHRFFAAWHANWKQSLSHGVPLDQPALCATNRVLGRPVRELPGVWNCQYRYLRYDAYRPHLAGSIILHYYAVIAPGHLLRFCIGRVQKKGRVDAVAAAIVRFPRLVARIHQFSGICRRIFSPAPKS